MRLWTEMQLPDALPAVDFDQNVVLGVFGGEVAAGSSLVLGRVNEQEEEIYVPYRVVSPEVAISTMSAPSHPYLLSVLPHTDKKIRLTEKEAP